MTGGRTMAIGLVVGLCAGFGPASSAAPIGDAIALYKDKRYAQARAILEPLVAAEPSNAAATYYLGMTLLRVGGPSALVTSRSMLGRAVQLAPGNEEYLSQFGGVCLLLADRDHSFTFAIEGRDAMNRAIASNPMDLDACDGLMQFDAKAPWPLGDPTRALALAGQIAARDPRRGLRAYLAIAARFERTGRREQALAATQAAQRLAPGAKQ